MHKKLKYEVSARVVVNQTYKAFPIINGELGVILPPGPNINMLGYDYSVYIASINETVVMYESELDLAPSQGLADVAKVCQRGQSQSG